MKRNIILLLVLSYGIMGCKKFVEDVGSPKNLISSNLVYSSDATAKSVISGIYSNMVNGSGWASGGTNSVTLYAGYSADEFKNFQNGGNYNAFYTNSLSPTVFSNNLWSEPYNAISNANALIEGLKSSMGVSAAVKDELTGEAKFVRAFCYFYLTNLFGEVPLVINTDYRQSALMAKSSISGIYSQIIADLKDAQNLLATDYTYGSGQRVVPNRSAATALLARVYFFNGNWSDAEAQATAVISNSLYHLESNLANTFLNTSQEAIWQLKPLGATFNTNEGVLFIPGPGASPTYVSLSPSLLSSFEAGDQRRVLWVDSVKVNGVYEYFPSKYKIRAGTTLKEYSMVIRLAEMFLIRAEARAQQNNLNGAMDDLNAVRSRVGLGSTSASSKTDLITAIQRERRIEMFSEWGHRWLDLKRSDSVDSVMKNITPTKTGVWSSFQQFYPIPRAEILADPNLIQNSGY